MRRAALGRSREIQRGFGSDIEADEPVTIEEARFELDYRFGPGPHWVIADAADDRFLGVVRLAPLDAVHRSARFAIGILDPARLGQGLGTETARLVVEFGFDVLDLLRIDLKVLADNERAIRSYEKVGFELEGRLRRTHHRDGEWIDDLIMAIVAES